jgi:DNA repair exonuclease SbcCD ATPase subunit
MFAFHKALKIVSLIILGTCATTTFGSLEQLTKDLVNAKEKYKIIYNTYPDHPRYAETQEEVVKELEKKIKELTQQQPNKEEIKPEKLQKPTEEDSEKIKALKAQLQGEIKKYNQYDKKVFAGMAKHKYEQIKKLAEQICAFDPQLKIEDLLPEEPKELTIEELQKKIAQLKTDLEYAKEHEPSLVNLTEQLIKMNRSKLEKRLSQK